MTGSSVQTAHDYLLANLPAGAVHPTDCRLCQPGTGTAGELKEVAGVPEDRTYTEREHTALLTDGIARETASLQSEKEALVSEKAELTTALEAEKTEKAALQSRIDVLEAEKAAEVTAKDAVQTEFDAYKADLSEKAAIAERKAERIARVKTAHAGLEESYFTDERQQRWAEMSDEAFESLVSDLEEAAKTTATAPVEGEVEVKPSETAAGVEQAARETAAFKGGVAPSSTQGSTLGKLLTAAGRVPAGVIE